MHQDERLRYLVIGNAMAVLLIGLVVWRNAHILLVRRSDLVAAT